MTAPHEPTSETQSREAHVAIGEHEQSLAAMTTRDGPSSTPVATSAQSPKAEQVGHYRLVREIASGGFGIVFEAQHATLGFLVAVKVIRRSANSAELREFASEARRLSLFIGQPGIVEIRDYGVEREADGTRRPYLVMNLLQGRGVGAEAGRPVRARSLTTYARVHSLSDGQKLEMFAKVCDAVHLTHEQRIVHRDLKPSNIIVHEPETGPARPVVIDFGISLTTTGTGQGRASGIAGTIPYMSPEQTRGTDELDRRSDVYTLGVILYELLCGQLPYPVLGGQRTDSYSVIQNTPPDFASSAATGISVHLRQILTRAMAKQPDQRYQTAADLAADLRAVLGGDVPREARRHLSGRARAIVRRTLVGRSWIFLAIAAIIAAGFTDYVGRRAVYDWTPLGSWFENQFVRTDLMPDMTDVVLVVRRDSTFFAAGMPDLKDKPTQRSKLRPYIGGLLEAIAEANPHCVVLTLASSASSLATPRSGRAFAPSSKVAAQSPAPVRRRLALRLRPTRLRMCLLYLRSRRFLFRSRAGGGSRTPIWRSVRFSFARPIDSRQPFQIRQLSSTRRGWQVWNFSRGRTRRAARFPESRSSSTRRVSSRRRTGSMKSTLIRVISPSDFAMMLRACSRSASA